VLKRARILPISQVCRVGWICKDKIYDLVGEGQVPGISIFNIGTVGVNIKAARAPIQISGHVQGCP